MTNQMKEIGVTEKFVIPFLYAYFILIIFVEVVRRYVFLSSSPWGEMTARYAFVYLVYFSAAVSVTYDEHIKIDLILEKLKPKFKLALLTYFDLSLLALGLLIIYKSAEVTYIAFINGTRMTGADINMGLALIALPIAWFILSLKVLQKIKERHQKLSKSHQSINTMGI